MEIHFKITGMLLMLLALLHFIFPKYFNWGEELKTLSLINKQMMIFHTFFIALAVFLAGMLCFGAAEELVNTKLGKTISFGMGIFWLLRLIVQFFGYAPDLWRGKKFETTIHILFSLLWTYFSFVFIWNATR